MEFSRQEYWSELPHPPPGDLPDPEIKPRSHLFKVLSLAFCSQHPMVFTLLWVSLLAQMVKNLPTMQKIRVQSLGGEDLLVKGMATHSSILA